jgi:hypothetical protein
MYYGGMDKNDLMKEGETAEALIERMSSYGFTVTRTELARWHRAGLLPRPQRRSLGRGYGMVSVYPPGTTEQLLALCTLHRSEKRLPYVAWRLWWEGYPVPISCVQQFLEEARIHWQQGIDELQKLQEHPEQLSKVLDQSAVMRFSRKTLSSARRRIGREDFPIFVGVLVRIALGTFEGYEVHPETGIDEHHIVEKGLGLLRARKNRLVNAGPWLTGDTGVVLQKLSSCLHYHPLGEDLGTLSEAELLNAREEVRCFLFTLESISRVFDSMFSRGAFGFSALADTIREFGARDQAFFLLSWRMFRTWGLGSGMDQILAAARLWQQIQFPLFQGLQQLRDEVPITAEVLASKQMGFALRWKLTMEGALAALSKIAQDPDVKAFFAHHPELTALVEASEREPGLQE